MPQGFGSKFMVNRLNSYLEKLNSLSNWEDFLLAESGLPGPRGNLASAVAQAGDETCFRKLIAAYMPAESGTANEFLPFCGLVGLGKLVADGDHQYLPLLRQFASDPHWRLREASAIALQAWGARDLPALLDEMEAWCRGGLLEQRAALAALCEPALLKKPGEAKRVLGLLDRVTVGLAGGKDRKNEDFRVLRKGLAYCWSVAVAALPEVGKPIMEKWFASPDEDVRWVMKENLKKNRLARMDKVWVEQWTNRLK